MKIYRVFVGDLVDGEKCDFCEKIAENIATCEGVSVRYCGDDCHMESAVQRAADIVRENHEKRYIN